MCSILGPSNDSALLGAISASALQNLLLTIIALYFLRFPSFLHTHSNMCHAASASTRLSASRVADIILIQPHKF